MKCLDCGMEMEQGTVQGIGQGGGHWYEFTSDEEKNWKIVEGDTGRLTFQGTRYLSFER